MKSLTRVNSLSKKNDNLYIGNDVKTLLYDSDGFIRKPLDANKRRFPVPFDNMWTDWSGRIHQCEFLSCKKGCDCERT